ncbi:MAG: ankyrin repeat domain-containing protein [Rickettsia sp.]|uniref:ankyrin repeat domain-containing protein n=1 Tax=Rickettsia sp. TaxID=789 RepID=UPI00397A8CCA
MFIRLFGTPYEKLIEAIKAENTAEAQKLITQMNTAELSKVDNGDTALMLAASYGLDKVCEMLMPKMSKRAINHVNKGYTALIWAARTGLDKVCEMLIPKMSEQAINHVNTIYGYIALTWAAWKGLDKVCEMLIPKMSEQAINHITFDCNTALIWATGNGLDKVCEMLIPKMSERAINHVNEYHDTALSLATKKGLKNTCDLLTNKKDNLANKADAGKKQEEQQQEVAATKTPHERLIEFLEKRGLNEEADSLRNGSTTLYLKANEIGDEGAKLIADSLKTNSTLTTLYLYDNKIGPKGLKTINEYLQRNKNIAEKKAENLNAEGNNLCSQEKYNEAIEKYKAAIKVKKGIDGYNYSEKNLYEENKAKAEKKYEEQQKQVVSAKNINIVDDNLTKWKKLVIDIQEKNQVDTRNLIKNINQDELNNIDDKGNTILIAALEKGLEVVYELLINKFDTPINNREIFETARDGLEKVCELLINEMPIPAINHVNNNGYTALTCAVANGYEKVCEILISKIDFFRN